MKKKTWRGLLAELIEDPKERERLAHELNVHEYTPTRWVKEGKTPRRMYLRKIPQIFPEHEAELKRLLIEEFSDLFPEAEEAFRQSQVPDQHIPSVYYERVISHLCSSGKLVSWTVQNLGLEQLAAKIPAIGRTFAYILQLSPSMRTLYLRMGIAYERQILATFGVTPEDLFFVGSDQLSGQAVTEKKAVASSTEAAFPFIRRGKVAGCLLIRASVPLSEAKRAMAGHFANLIALSFEDCDFVELCDLQPVPNLDKQREIIEIIGKHTPFVWSMQDPHLIYPTLSKVEDEVVLEGRRAWNERNK